MLPRFFRASRRLVSSGVAAQDLSFGPVELGRIYHLSRLTWYDETAAVATSITSLVSGHGYDHLLEQALSGAGLRFLTDTFPIHLFEGETLTVRFVGSTANDSLRLYIEGWWHEKHPDWGDLCTVCSPGVLLRPAVSEPPPSS